MTQNICYFDVISMLLRYNAAVHNAAMSFRVHHYIGSWESFRSPGVDIRGKSDFKKRNNQNHLVVDNTTPRFQNETWLSHFAKLVGTEKALDLTQRIRIREEWEVERKIMELAQTDSNLG